MLKRSISALAISSLISLAGVLTLVNTPASAIESSGVGILPANPRADTPRSKSIFIHTAPAGSVKTDAVTVFNHTDTTQILAVYPTDSQTSSDGAFACAQQVETPKRVGNWITVSAATISLKSGESANIPFTITIPNNTEAGEHNGCMAVQAVNQSTEADSNGISLSFRSAIRVAVTIPGDLRTDIAILRTRHEPVDNTTTRLSAIVRNSGTVSADTTFKVGLMGIWGGHFYAEAGGTYPVFPDTDSTFNFELKNPFWGGWYRTGVTASYHQINTDGTRAKTATTVTADQPVLFVMPQPVALLVETVVLLVLIGGGTSLLLRRRHLRIVAEQARQHTVTLGETITSIADQYHVSWRRIASLNKLEAPYTLTPNQQLAIPQVKTHTSPTRSADT